MSTIAGDIGEGAMAGGVRVGEECGGACAAGFASGAAGVAAAGVSVSGSGGNAEELFMRTPADSGFFLKVRQEHQSRNMDACTRHRRAAIKPRLAVNLTNQLVSLILPPVCIEPQLLEHLR